MSINRITTTGKALVVAKKDASPRFLMAEGEYISVIVGASHSGSEYVVSDGIIQPGSAVPNHYHKWDDQAFHVLEGCVEARVGDEWHTLGAGDSVHCPRGITHYIRNEGSEEARVLSYIFPGHWAEDFFAETARQIRAGAIDRQLIEEQFGVVYVEM